MLLQVFMYYKACPNDNEYAHPMDLCPIVDLNEQRVIHIDAYDTPPDIPMQAANYHMALLRKPFREAAKPWKVVQPEVRFRVLRTCPCWGRVRRQGASHPGSGWPHTFSWTAPSAHHGDTSIIMLGASPPSPQSASIRLHTSPKHA